VSKSPYFEGKKSLEAITIFSQCYPQGRHNKAYDSKHAILSCLTSSQIWVIPLVDDFPVQVPISPKWGKKKKNPFILPLVKFGSFLLWMIDQSK
jgi:hypothetical protein